MFYGDYNALSSTSKYVIFKYAILRVFWVCRNIYFIIFLAHVFFRNTRDSLDGRVIGLVQKEASR